MVGILHDLLPAAVMPAIGWGFSHLIPALPLPNFGLILTTCLACIWAFVFLVIPLCPTLFSCHALLAMLFLSLLTAIVSVSDIDLVGLFCSKSHIKQYTY